MQLRKTAADIIVIVILVAIIVLMVYGAMILYETIFKIDMI